MLSKERCREIAAETSKGREVWGDLFAIADAIHAALVEDSCKPGQIIEPDLSRRAKVREIAERLYDGASLASTIDAARYFVEKFDAEYDRQEKEAGDGK